MHSELLNLSSQVCVINVYRKNKILPKHKIVYTDVT